jgi:threonine dehydratase
LSAGEHNQKETRVITLDDIEQAQRRISHFLRRTPMVKSFTLSRLLGTNVHLKMEVFQRTGSFKPRGAFNQILQMNEEQKRRGVVAISGGNFAQGVAYAGKVLGVRSLVLMPSYTPANYVEATRDYGADVELAPTFIETLERSREYQKQGLSLVHAWDNPGQMAGNGTVGLELLEDLPQMTDIVVSIGGGGLIAGIIVALKTLRPEVRVWGVETEGADAMAKALQAGRVVEIEPSSLARTLGAPYVSEDALTLAQRHLEKNVVVSDREAFEAQVLLLERAKVLTELAASCTLAAAFHLKGFFTEENHVVLLLCGGNVSVENLLDYHQQFSAGKEKGRLPLG